MITNRSFVFVFLGCWMLSIPVMIFDMDVYHADNVHRSVSSDHRDVNLSTRAPDRIWPDFNGDNRIHAQQTLHKTAGDRTKLILLWSMFGEFSGKHSSDWESAVFASCPVSQCQLTHKKSLAPKADVIVAKNRDHLLYDIKFRETRRPEQALLWYNLESPHHSPYPNRVTVNWTATYRRDSTLVAPYGQFVPYTDLPEQQQQPHRNYAKGKTKAVAWFVSNCGTENGRMSYAKQLRRHIQVDIYGLCGKLRCSKSNDKCRKMLNKDYKFYLSFENSNCKDYITEKFFINGLSNDILPIVMGAPPEDYAAVAPPHSYIHVDEFPTPADLAAYLHVLDRNDTLYNEYFRWKGRGEFIDTTFWCRVCALTHEADLTKTSMWYRDLKAWWRGPGVCVKTQFGQGRSWATWRGAGRQDVEDVRKAVQVNS